MPYISPVVRLPIASCPGTRSLNHSKSHSESEQQDGPISDRGWETKVDLLPPSRAHQSMNHRRQSSPSESAWSTVGSSTSGITAFEINRLKSNGPQSLPPASEYAHQSPTDSPVSSVETSPPLSPPTSIDEETSPSLDSLKETPDQAQLQAVTRPIEQHLLGLPDMYVNIKTKTRPATPDLSFSQIGPSNTADTLKPKLLPPISSSGDIWKYSQSISYTDTKTRSGASQDKLPSRARSNSECKRDNSGHSKVCKGPALVRKSSGDIVQPALRGSSRRARPQSMPGVRVDSKAVHFPEDNLEHIRLFLREERPTAISDKSSPVDSDDDEIESPGDTDSSTPSPPFNWEIQLNKFQPQSVERKPLPVKIEQMYLSEDTEVLIGIVAVRNLAFHKSVVARFTLDNWKTASEVVAEFDHHGLKRQITDGCDRFIFKIKLEDQTNLENKTMFFCVRYNVNKQVYWDNNNSINYQVNFSKLFKPQDSKPYAPAKRAHSLNALPRSNSAPPLAIRTPRMPPSDDFAQPEQLSLFAQPYGIVSSSPISFRGRPSERNITPDVPDHRLGTARQQWLVNRYDLDTSIAQAVQAAHTTQRDRGRV